MFLENPLTEDGDQYVKDAVADNPDNANHKHSALFAWRTFYGYLFD